MMLDATKQDIQRQLLEKELESVGIRLNKRKPNIYFKVIIYIYIYIVTAYYIVNITIYLDKKRWRIGI